MFPFVGKEETRLSPLSPSCNYLYLFVQHLAWLTSPFIFRTFLLVASHSPSFLQYCQLLSFSFLPRLFLCLHTIFYSGSIQSYLTMPHTLQSYVCACRQNLYIHFWIKTHTHQTCIFYMSIEWFVFLKKVIFCQFFFQEFSFSTLTLFSLSTLPLSLWHHLS